MNTNTATDFTAVAERYIATWNETDPAARRALVEAAYTSDAVYIDPLVEAAGHDAIDATLADVQTQFAGLVFTLGGPVDGHHNLARFQWHLGPEGDGEPAVIGFDVIVIAEDGRIREVGGFLDKVPAGA